LIHFYPDWSDRRIAEICGVSPSTVKSVRLEDAAGGCPSDQFEHLDSRIGRDGRQRPANPAQSRQRVLAAIESHPEGSLRGLARIAGTSPETVRRIRIRLQHAPELATDGLPVPLHIVSDVQGFGTRIGQGHEDPALATCSDGFTEFLRSTAVDKDPASVAALVPLGRVYEVADEARRRAAFWSQLEEALNRRGRESARYGQLA
jgi:hypothetical protein